MEFSKTEFICLSYGEILIMINLTSDYYNLRRIVPYIIYIICEWKLLSNKLIGNINKTIIYLISSLFIIGVYGLLLKIPFKNLFFMGWQYDGLLEWCVFIIVYLKYLIYAGYSNLYSLNIMVQSASCGGWLYEIPLFHPTTMFFHDKIVINSQIVSILLLSGLLYKKEFKINRKILISFIVYVLSFICLFYYPSLRLLIPYFMRVCVVWLMRVPTMIMLVLLITGIRRNDNESIT